MSMDDAELDALFASCMPWLVRTASRMQRNSQDFEDVLQEGLLSAFQNLGQFQGRSKFSTWLYSIIRNAAKMHARKMGSRPLFSIERELLDENSFFLAKAFRDGKPNPEEMCAQKERSRILRTALQHLPPRYQRVIELCDIEGLGGRDAAAALGMTLTSLKTCLHRARRLVSRRIQQNQLSGGTYSPEERQNDVRRRRRPKLKEDTKPQRCRRNFYGDGDPIDSRAPEKQIVVGVRHGYGQRENESCSYAGSMTAPGDGVVRNGPCTVC